MFKIAVDNLVQSIGEDVYLPSPSTAASKNLQPLSLVDREGSFLPFSKFTDYHTTDFTLKDVLVNKDVEFVVNPEQSFCTFNRESTVKLDRSLEGTMKGIFDADLSRSDTVEIKAPFGELSILEVNMQGLLDSLHNSKINMHHELVRELACERRRALCVVVGVVKTTTDTDVTAVLTHKFNMNLDDSDDEQDKADGDSKAKAVKVPLVEEKQQILDGGASATHEKTSNRSLHLPAGTVVAYQVMELAVSDNGSVRLVVSHGAKGGFHMKPVKTSSGAKVSPKD